MNAPVRPPTLAAAQPTDAQLIACDAIVEFASHMIMQSSALLASASAADLPEVEASLWAIKRVFVLTTRTWRESVPHQEDGGAL